MMVRSGLRGGLISTGMVCFGIVILGLAPVRAEEKDIVAKVGQRAITKGTFERFLKTKAGNRAVNKKMKQDLLSNLVQNMALSDLAEKRGLDKRGDIQELLALNRDALLANEFIKEEVNLKVKVDERQAEDYYEKHLDQFKQPDQVRIRQITIRMNTPASAEEKAKAREQAEGILKRIKSGEDFARLAEAFSDDPVSKTKGGDLGFQPKGFSDNPFEKAAAKAVQALKPGEVSEPIETPFDYRIVKVEAEKKGEVQLFEAVKDKVMGLAREEVKKEKIKELVDQALKEAEAKIYRSALE